MLKIEVRNDKVIIDGYVNAVGRDSRPISSRGGKYEKFIEQIKPGAFRASLANRKDVDLLLNHRADRKLGSTGSGELKLWEDNIGLRAHAEISDAETIEKARAHKLRGWSFGMFPGEDEFEERAGDIPRRHLKTLDMFEVSLIDNTMIPCYAGTSVECRAEGAVLSETRSFEDDIEVTAAPDLSELEKRLATLRAEISIADAEYRLWKLKQQCGVELRYNPYHDPMNGRFTTGNFSLNGGAYLNVPQGMAGKGEYVVEKDNFSNKKTKTSIDKSENNDIIEAKQESTKSEWDNNLKPRGQLPASKSEKEASEIVQKELGVSKRQADNYTKAVSNFTGSDFSDIRRYQRGEKTEDISARKAKSGSEKIEDYIKKAPRWNGGETFRGCSISDDDLNSYVAGKKIKMGGTASWSDKEDVARRFSGSNTSDKLKNKVVYHCATQSKGTGIEHLTSFAGESEILCSKDSEYEVVSVNRKKNKYNVIHVYLKEV